MSYFENGSAQSFVRDLGVDFCCRNLPVPQRPLTRRMRADPTIY